MNTEQKVKGIMELAEKEYPYPIYTPGKHTWTEYLAERGEQVQLRAAFIKGLEWKGGDWISVEDRLPENLGWCNDQVLFVASESVRKGCYDYEDGFWHELDGGKYQDIGRIKNGEKPNGAVVTHWMPLPEPPKKLEP